MNRATGGELREAMKKLASEAYVAGKHSRFFPTGEKIDKAIAALSPAIAPAGDAVAGVRDTLIVAANNPVAHGGLEGLRTIMRAQAERLRALAALSPAIAPAGGDPLRRFVESLECECDPDFNTRVCGRCAALSPAAPQDGETCGCGKPWEYETTTGRACNKYFRCKAAAPQDGAGKCCGDPQNCPTQYTDACDCRHDYRMDQDHPPAECCQKCGHVRNATRSGHAPQDGEADQPVGDGWIEIVDSPYGGGLNFSTDIEDMPRGRYLLAAQEAAK